MVWLRRQRRRAVNIQLSLVLIIGLVALATSLLAWVKGTGTNLPYYSLVYVAIAFLFLFPKIPDTWRSAGFLLIIFGFSIFSFYAGWLESGGRVFLLMLVVVSALFVSPRLSIFVSGLSLLTYIAFALAYGLHWLALSPLPSPDTAPPIIIEGVGFAMSLGVVAVSLWFYSQALKAASRANLEAQRSRASFHNIVERSSDGIIVTDQEGMVRFANLAAGQFFEPGSEILVGQPFPYPSETGSVVVDTVDRDGQKAKTEIRKLETQWEDSPAHLILLRDVTEQKRLETEHENLIAELESRNAELERFTYTISHDLKSPLITIRGFTGFLEKDALDGNLERMKADLERVNDATDKMQRLLNELLELSRIGRVTNPPRDVPFGDVVHEALELVRGQIEARRIQVWVAPDLPTVYGDRVRLVEAVQNLLDNAVKFMGSQPEPRLEIGYRLAGETGWPVLFVRDNGIGIAPQYHERVFGLFNKLNPRSEGTGIGLSLVKRIVEFHGGNIWVESEGDNRGSTFCFIIAPNPNQPDDLAEASHDG